MKRHLSLVVSVLVLIAMVVSVASCDLVPGSDKKHEHTFSEDWSSDATNHWKTATCDDNDECKSATAEVAAHTFSDDTCTVCGYKKTVTEPVEHTHTYETDWTFDDVNHWHAANCAVNDECATAKQDEAAHDFTNGDCVCGAKAPVAAPDGSAENPFALTVPGELKVNYAGGDALVWYTFTAAETKNLNITLSSANANMAYGTATDTGLTYSKGETQFRVSITAGVTYYVGFCTMDGNAEEFTVTGEYVVSNYEAPIVVGSNSVYFSPEEIEADEATRKFTVVEAGEYKLGGSVVFGKLLDKDGNEVAKNGDNPSYPYVLEAGEYTVVFSMFSMFGNQADTAYAYNVEKYVAPEGYNVLGKINGADAEFTYTADAEGFIYITVENAAGGSVDIDTYSVNGAAAIKGGNGIYVKLGAGDAVTVKVSADEGATAKVVGQWTDSDLDPEGLVDTMEGEGTSASPLLINANGAYLVSGVNSYPGKYFKYTATSNVKVVITADVPSLWTNGYGGNSAKTVMTASLLAGESVTYIACMDYGVCDVILTVTTEEYVPASDDELKVGETANVFVDAASTSEVTFTVTEAGSYIINVLTENGQLADYRTGMPVATYGNPYTLTFTEEDLADFADGITLTYVVSTTDSKAGYVDVKVEEKTEDDEEDAALSGTYVDGDGVLSVEFSDNTVIFTHTHPMSGFVNTVVFNYTVADGVVSLTDTETGNAAPTMYGITLVDGAPCVAIYEGWEYTLSTGGSEGGDDGDDTTLPEVGTGTGTEEDPYIIAIPGDFTCAFPGGMTPIWYAFAAPADGTVTISTTFGADGWLQLGTEPMFCNTNEGEGTSLTLFVEKDALYYASVGDWSEVASTVPFSITFTEGTGSEGGDDDDDTTEIVTEGYLYDGESEVTITDEQYTAGKVYYAFTPWNEGEYAFQSGDLYISGVYLDGEALTTNDNGYYVLSAYTQYAVEITCTWAPSAGTYTVNANFQYPLGHQETPIYFGFDYEFGTPVTVAFSGYSPIWYTFYASTTGTLTVSTETSGATILVTAVLGSEIESVDGTATISIIQGRQYYVGVMGAEGDIVFTPSIVEGEYVGNGTMNAPNFITVGDNTASVPQYDCVWFVYKATSSGTLTVSTTNELCAWYFKDQDLYATAGDKSIHVEEGSMVYLYIETTDFSAADIAFTASFKADPTMSYYEGDVITDGSAANDIVIAENTWIVFPFNGAGQYVITWDNADAIVELYDWNVYSNVAIENGAIITGSAWGNELTVYLPDYAAGTVKLTITPYTAPAVDEGFAGSGASETDPIIIDDAGSIDVAPTYSTPIFVQVSAGVTATLDCAAQFIDFTNGPMGTTVTPSETTVYMIFADSDDCTGTITATLATGGDDEEDDSEQGGSTAAEPVASITLVAPGNFVSTAWQTLYTANATGTYVITATGYDNIQKTYIQYSTDGGASNTTVAQGTTLNNNMPYSITLNAGDVLSVRLYGWSTTDKGTEITILLTPAE